jgi:hypothetical protein
MGIETRPVTIETIKAANLLNGGKWFDKSTMRFFRSVILPTVYNEKYFITSETDPYGIKRYSIREAIDGGKDICTVGAFHSYVSVEDARRALDILLEC